MISNYTYSYSKNRDGLNFFNYITSWKKKSFNKMQYVKKNILDAKCILEYNWIS